MTISVVVPVFNGAQTLETLVERLVPVLTDLATSYEIVLVNDGSDDESWDVITKIAAARPECRGIRLLRNYGQHNALLAGIRVARFDVIVTLDDDLQNPPEEIPRLLEALSSGADVVYGRPARASHSLARRLASRVSRMVLKEAMGATGAESVSPFRAFRSALRQGFAATSGPTVNIDVLLSWSTTRYARVLVQHDERAAGESNYTIWKLVQHALNLLTGFSTRPLRLASLVGFGFTITGIGIFGYVLERYFQTGGTVPGFAFLASIISVFSGAQLFTIGVIGEYLARMYNRMLERPPYVIAEFTLADEQSLSESNPAG